MCGSINIEIISGASYFVTFIDNAFRMAWGLRAKNQKSCLRSFKDFMHKLKEKLENS